VITYVDASVLLRVILREDDPISSWRDIRPVSSELIRVECLRVMDRARLGLRVDEVTIARNRSDALATLSGFELAPITSFILERAADPFPTALGSLDAIHLATALALREDNPELEFATHDHELATAARSMGFTVVGST
jgi:predicted nucleic acid-binding protein